MGENYIKNDLGEWHQNMKKTGYDICLIVSEKILTCTLKSSLLEEKKFRDERLKTSIPFPFPDAALPHGNDFNTDSLFSCILASPPSICAWIQPMALPKNP